MSSQFHILNRKHIWQQPMDATIAPGFTDLKNPPASDVVFLQVPANVRVQGWVRGSGSIAGQFFIDASEGFNPLDTTKEPGADLVPLDLDGGCGIHGLSGGMAFSNGALTLTQPDLAGAGPAKFLINIALPFQWFRVRFVPSTPNALALLDVLVSARP